MGASASVNNLKPDGINENMDIDIANNDDDNTNCKDTGSAEVKAAEYNTKDIIVDYEDDVL